MTRLPDRSQSRAVLVGVGRYQYRDALPDIPAVWANLVDLEQILADPETGTFDRTACRVVSDPDSPQDIAEVLSAASDEASDVLLVYWCGHGVVDEAGRGYLALGSTRTDNPELTAFSMDLLRRVFETSRAANRILLLDFCQSGRSPVGERWLDTSAPGMSVLTSSAPSPPHTGSAHTAFTEVLLQALSTTEPATLDLISDRIHHLLAHEGATTHYRIDSASNLLLRRHTERTTPAGEIPGAGQRQRKRRRAGGWETLVGSRATRYSPESANNLAVDLLARYQLTGDIDMLSDAVRLLREVVAGSGSEDPEYLSNLASALQHLFDRTGALTALEEAVQLSRASLAATASTDPGRAWHLSNLGSALQRLYERTGERACLDEAVSACRDSIEVSAPTDPRKVGYLSNLGSTLRLRYEITRDVSDLEEAVAVAREAARGIPEDDPTIGLHLTNLGIGLLTLHEHSRSRESLAEAHSAFSRAVDVTPEGHSDRASRLNNMAAVLLRSAAEESGGDVETPRQAIDVLRQALAATDSGHPDKARYLSNLSTALQLASDYSDDAGLLDEAVRCARVAIDLTPQDHPDHSLNLYRLGRALRLRTARD